MLNGGVQLLHDMRYNEFPGTKWLGRRFSRSKLSMPCSEVTPNVSEDRREQFIFQNDPLVAKRVPLSYHIFSKRHPSIFFTILACIMS